MTTMNIILLHDHFDTEHLTRVSAEMRELGAPIIRAVWVECYDAWVALEGCHRLRAAHALNITPEIDPIEYSDATGASLGLDWDDDATIEQIVDSAHSRYMLRF